MKKPGPKRKYDAKLLVGPLKQVWLAADQPCSKLLKAALPVWLKYLPGLPVRLEKDLLAMSPATLDRLLKPVRVQYKRHGLCTTKPGKLLKHHVPLRDGPADTSELGHIEADKWRIVA
ncbi:MAG: integrase, partial [Limisphaerales bacterium]